MADEIQATGSLTITSGWYSFSKAINTDRQDLASTIAIGGVQTIGTSAEAIAMGDVSTAGYAYFINLDATNFVEIGALDGSSNLIVFLKLLPGQAAGPLPLGTNAPNAKADTGSVRLEYYIQSR